MGGVTGFGVVKVTGISAVGMVGTGISWGVSAGPVGIIGELY